MITGHVTGSGSGVRHAVLGLLVACFCGVASAVVGWLAPVVALGGLTAAFVTRYPLVLPVLCVPATFALVRVQNALSIADLVLIVGTGVALVLCRGRGVGTMGPLLAAGCIYLLSAAPVLLLFPYSANYVEWVHEVFLVLGSMIVGYLLGDAGKAAIALRLLALICCAFGVGAVSVAISGWLTTGTFQPAYVLTVQKNTTGGMLAICAVIAVARPPWLGWTRRFSVIVGTLCFAGVIASQSRQGLLGLVVGVLIVSFRKRSRGGRPPLVALSVAFIALIGVGVAVAQQLGSDNRFNSAFQRVDWYSQSVQLWQQSPLFGVGMRWWYTDRFAGLFDSFQPPNAELEVLTETGVFGLVGFLAMFLGALVLLAQMNPIYGTVGLAVVAARFTQGQFDLYWVAGQASLLWIVAGICFGVQHRDGDRGVRMNSLSLRLSAKFDGNGSRRAIEI